MTMAITTTITGDIEVGLMVAPIDFAIKVVMYFFHEKLWILTKFGITTAKKSGS